MLYNVSIHADAKKRQVVPFMVKIEEGKPPRVTDTDARDLERMPPEMEFAEISAGLMGEIVHDPEDDKGQPSGRGGFYGVPLWLTASTALEAPVGIRHPERVWLASRDLAFRDFVVVGEDNFARGKYATKVPAAVYAQGAIGKIIIAISNGLAEHPAAKVMRRMDQDTKDLWKHAQRYGIEAHPFYDPEHACGVGEGICFSFRDWSRLRVGHQFLQVDYSDMDYGLKEPVTHVPQALGRH